MFWDELLPPKKLSADSIHKFMDISPLGPVTHVRVNIFPDGGLSRLRLFGTLAE
jgi:allantoicase